MSRNFGDIVKRRRSALGMTQARLAELVGRSISTIRAWERNRTHPSDTETLAAVVAVLGITEPELIDADLELPGGIPARAPVQGPHKVATAPGHAPRVIGTGTSVDQSLEVDPPAPEGPLVAAQGDQVGLPEELPDELPDEAPEEPAEQSSGEVVLSKTDQSQLDLAPSSEGLDDSSVALPSGDLDEPSASVSSSDEIAKIDLGERTRMLEGGGERVLGVGTSAEALRPEPIDVPEDIPGDGGGDETQVVEHPAASEDDPFAATEVALPPVAPRHRAADLATALGSMSSSTMALERRPVAPPATEPVFDNYLDDPDEERRYRIRAVLTLVIMIVLFLFLRWSLSGMTDAVGQLWSNFRVNLKI